MGAIKINLRGRTIGCPFTTTQLWKGLSGQKSMLVFQGSFLTINKLMIIVRWKSAQFWDLGITLTDHFKTLFGDWCDLKTGILKTWKKVPRRKRTDCPSVPNGGYALTESPLKMTNSGMGSLMPSGLHR